MRWKRTSTGVRASRLPLSALLIAVLGVLSCDGPSPAGLHESSLLTEGPQAKRGSSGKPVRYDPVPLEVAFRDDPADGLRSDGASYEDGIEGVIAELAVIGNFLLNVAGTPRAFTLRLGAPLAVHDEQLLYADNAGEWWLADVPKATTDEEGWNISAGWIVTGGDFHVDPFSADNRRLYMTFYTRDGNDLVMWRLYYGDECDEHALSGSESGEILPDGAGWTVKVEYAVLCREGVVDENAKGKNKRGQTRAVGTFHVPAKLTLTPIP